MDLRDILNSPNNVLPSLPSPPPLSLPPPPPPSTPPRKRLTRDQRRDILLMRGLGHTYERIAAHLKVSERAVQYTCKKGQATPQHLKAGRPPRLNKEETDRVEEFITQSKETRRMTYLQVAEALWPEGEVSAESVKYALYKRGYRRYLAMRKPPLSEANRVARLAWAREHINWTIEQWRSILWSDETWVTARRHRRTWVTRKPGEELEPTCIITRVRKQQGWMFWGSFHGDTKGPAVFWEKAWGTITKETYIEHIIPMIDDYIRINSGLYVMQDNAPGHSAKLTIEEFQRRGIRLVPWPAFSPDLNLIETVWNEMKDWIAQNYPEKATYPQLRQRVTEAWNVIGRDLLSQLIDTMPQRCQAVIDANGMHTKW